jgi:malate synthase
MPGTSSTEKPKEDRLLTSELVKFVQDIAHRYGAVRNDLLAARQVRREEFRQGNVDRLEETAHIRQALWKVDPVPAELLERRVELLGGCSRQEIIQGMNCGAKSYIADLWNMTANDPGSVLRAHKNLERAVDSRLQFVDENGDRVRVNPASTTRIFFAPRPLHVKESSVRDQGGAVPASFFDLAVYASYNAVKLRVRQAGVYLYLRGVHSHQEARLWRQVMEHIEEHLHLPRGTFRATVMVDSLSTALEADEILFELSHHSAGLSIDPQAYAADHVQLFSAPDRAVLPDRERIGLNEHFLRSVSLMTISTCHKRQAHAIGAPAYILPPDERGKTQAGYLDMIADKEREAVDGHDGTIVGHPGLVNPAMMEFNKSMPKAHQMYYERPDKTRPSDLVQRPVGTISTDGLLGAVRTVLGAMVAKEKGLPVVEQGGRLHDRSSVRLSTLLLWSWVRSSHGIVTDTGLEIHNELISYLIKKEGTKLFGRADAAAKESGNRAVAILTAAMFADTPPNDLLG